MGNWNSYPQPTPWFHPLNSSEMGPRKELQVWIDQALSLHVLLPRRNPLLFQGWPSLFPSPIIGTPRPNTHAHTHTHPTFQQEDFFWGRRQGKIQEVKGNPYLSISSSLRHKKSRKHQLLPCLYFFFSQQKGGWHDQSNVLKWNKKGIQRHLWSIYYSARLTFLGHLEGCMIVPWHMRLWPI